MGLEVRCCGIEGVLALKIAGSAPPSFLASRDRNGEVAISTVDSKCQKNLRPLGTS